MKLSKLEEKGAVVPKVFKPTKKENTLEEELKEVKELLQQILQKLNEKS